MPKTEMIEFPDNFQAFRALAAAEDAMRSYVRVSCNLVPCNDRDVWIGLVDMVGTSRVLDVQLRQGQCEARVAYNNQHFDQVEKERRPILGSHAGCHDLFYPVLAKGRFLGWLVSGPFNLKLPRRAALAEQWRAWTGQPPTLTSPDFMEYVNAVSELPVLDGGLLECHFELNRLLARLLTGAADAKDLLAQVEDLKVKGFAMDAVRQGWVNAAAWGRQASAVSPTYWRLGALEPWEKRELGINRAPEVALAAMPWDPLHPENAAAQSRSLQLACARLARQLPETVADKLENWGALFLTSLKPGQGPTQARLELAERARKLVELASRETGTAVLVGVGEKVDSPVHLEASARDASRALQWCVYLGKPVVFFEDLALEDEPLGLAGLAAASRGLREALVRGARAELEASRDLFVRSMLRVTGERPEAVRAHLMAMVAQAVDLVERRSGLPTDGLKELTENWETRLAGVQASSDLVAEFKAILEAASTLLKGREQGGADLGMAQLVMRMERNFMEDHQLGRTARQMGISASALGRRFKAFAGVGFSEYLQRVRIEQARRLLRGSSMSVAAISQECGYTSSSYFVRAFKKEMKETPQAYRRRMAEKLAENGPDD
jgi:AraC-like DNA-binding protein